MQQTSPRVHNGGKWTDGRFRGFITSALRSAMRRWPPKYEAIKAAYVGTRINPKTKRMAQRFCCAACGKACLRNNVQVDHTLPIGTCATWDEFIERLFCEQDNLQVLCKKCHKKKTKEEMNANQKRTNGRKEQPE